VTETQLRVLVAVAEAGGFSAGAARLEMSQPAVSRAIASLEEELGVHLLTRTPGAVSLTNVGRRIVAHAREMLARSEAMRQLAGAAGGNYEGRLRVGCPPGLGAIVAPIIGRFCATNPAAEVDLHEGADDELLEAVRRRTIDVAVVARTADDLDVTAIARTPLVVALSVSHPLAGGASVGLAAVEAEPLILAHNGFEHLVLDLLRTGGRTPRVVFEVAETASALALAEHELGVVVLPALLAKSHPAGVAVRRLDPPVTIRLGLAIRLGEDVPLLARAFVAEYAAEHVTAALAPPPYGSASSSRVMPATGMETQSGRLLSS
jgi:DNA-binding transcriptional LysR family regulator